MYAMGFEEEFVRALQATEIHRGRRSRLLTVGTTDLPYILLNRSVVNKGDTVVRQGVVRVEEPSIFLFQQPHQFEGFDNGGKDPRDALVAVGRMARFPPARYSNRDMRMDVVDSAIDIVLGMMERRLDETHDDQTGLISGPVELWHLSLIVYAGLMVRQSASGDLTDILRRLRER